VPKSWQRYQLQQQNSSPDTAEDVSKTITASRLKQVTAQCSDGQQNLESLEPQAVAEVSSNMPMKEIRCTVTNMQLCNADEHTDNLNDSEQNSTAEVSPESFKRKLRDLEQRSTVKLCSDASERAADCTVTSVQLDESDEPRCADEKQHSDSLEQNSTTKVRSDALKKYSTNVQYDKTNALHSADERAKSDSKNTPDTTLCADKKKCRKGKSLDAQCSDGKQNLSDSEQPSMVKVSLDPPEKTGDCTITSIQLDRTAALHSSGKTAKLDSENLSGTTLLTGKKRKRSAVAARLVDDIARYPITGILCHGVVREMCCEL